MTISPGPVLDVNVTSNLGVLPLQLQVLASLVVAHPGLGRLSSVCLEWFLGVKTDNL